MRASARSWISGVVVTNCTEAISRLRDLATAVDGAAYLRRLERASFIAIDGQFETVDVSGRKPA